MTDGRVDGWMDGWMKIVDGYIGTLFSFSVPIRESIKEIL
jgi:hypothetical protein